MRHKLKNFGLNTRSFVYAVVIHVLLGVLLFASFNWETVVVAKPKPQGPEPVKATVVREVDIQKQLEAIQEQEAKKKQEELEAEKRLEDMVRQAKVAEEKRKQEQLRLAEIEKKKKEAQQKAELEAKKREAEELRVAKAKEEQERKRQAEETERKKQEEAKQAAEEKRRQELAEQKRNEQELAEKQRKEQELAEKRKREQELAEKRRREAELQARLEEERVQRLVDEALARYTPIIQQKVSRNWSRPPGAQVGLSAWVRVRLTPSGEVVSAQVVRSSGSIIFDRSVENAVLKASPLPIPQEQKLNDRFREIQFNFNPDEKLISKS